MPSTCSSTTQPLLPDELLLSIFAYSSPLDLYRASLASRGVRNIVSSPILWQAHIAPWTVGKQDDELHRDVSQWLEQSRKAELRSLLQKELDGKGVARDVDLPPLYSFEGIFEVSQTTDTPASGSSSMPDFYEYYRLRMNQDDQFLRIAAQLEEQTQGQLTSLCKAVLCYGDDARDLMHALLFDQTITKDIATETLTRFAKGGQDTAESWPLRAYDVHTRASTGQRQPNRNHHMSLCHFAQTMLATIQRAEALAIMRSLKDAATADQQRATDRASLRQRIVASAEATEEALKGAALFRGGEPIEISRYLDLLSIHVGLKVQEHEATSGSKFSTSRSLVEYIITALSGLGFAIAPPADFLDLANSYLDLSLFCPAQRSTLPLTVVLIFCAVARRLCIAAALCNTPGRITAMVLEEGPQPEGAGSSASTQTDLFYVDLSKSCPIQEADDLVEFRRMWMGIDPGAEASFEEPAVPLDIFARVARNLMSAAQNGNHLPRVFHVNAGRRDGVPGHNPGNEQAEDNNEDVSFSQTLGDLLTQHPIEWNLAKLPTSMQPLRRSRPPSLPVSRAGRAHDDENDSVYGAIWIMSQLQPELLGERGRQWLAQQITTSRELDVLLLPGGPTELRMREQARERQERRTATIPDVLPGAYSEDEVPFIQPDWDEDDSDSERYPASFRSAVFRSTARQLFINDHLDPEPQFRPTPPPTTTQPVKYTMGTLFHHRAYDYRAVIVSWDPECSASESWIRQMRVDNLPEGGRHQPFYSTQVEDGTSRYVAQCNVETALEYQRRRSQVADDDQDEGAQGEQAAEDTTTRDTDDVGENFVHLIGLRDLGKTFRCFDVNRRRLRKRIRAQAAWPDDGSGDEEDGATASFASVS